VKNSKVTCTSLSPHLTRVLQGVGVVGGRSHREKEPPCIPVVVALDLSSGLVFAGASGREKPRVKIVWAGSESSRPPISLLMFPPFRSGRES
jgi:hypothetical protein